MATIFIHHHFEDTLAAEVVAGALLSLAETFLAAYPPGPQVVRPVPAGTQIDNIVLWTDDAADDPGMTALLKSLAVRRARCTLLLHNEVAAPDDLIRCDCWPLFDRRTPWLGYRRTLRSLFAPSKQEERPARRAAPVTSLPEPVSSVRAMGIGLPESWSELPLIPIVVLSGLFVWALLR